PMPLEAGIRSRWSAEPTLREVMLLVLISGLLFAATVVQFQNYGSAVTNFGDSEAYVSVASAIHHWDFSSLQIKQFWGYPYAMAIVSIVTHLSDQSCLILVSSVCCFVTLRLAYELWGGWITG